MHNSSRFDVIVIGGGHAGTEAAYAAARMGATTLLLTQSLETIGQMSCNPAVGGIGKGHLVREIDAMGGVMARAADLAGIHFRVLNRRKGAAVRATRAQADRTLYRTSVRTILESQERLSVFQQEVADLEIESGRVVGVVTRMGLRFSARIVVLTTGTFLGGRLHLGLENHAGGRAGDAPSNRLAAKLRELPFRVDRLKTGTPPRLDGRTVEYDRLAEQPGDEPTPIFSSSSRREDHPRQVSCWITRTNDRTHEIIRRGLDRSPMYTGMIDGVGPRYCPSVEDKVVRFADRNSHQIFVEPEGLDTHEVYPNGISTSLPFDVQEDMVRSIEGFHAAHITRPGYAIEYDFFDPRDLRYSLETRCVDGLFFAGQINGTTGYEEAAAQGLLAGLNAALKIRGEPAWHPQRDTAYLGVLVDDLINRGTSEPYRMFTSRAEHRLLLREDNADLRLMPVAWKLGLVDEARWRSFEAKRDAVEREKQRLRATWVRPGRLGADGVESLPPEGLSRDTRADDLLRRPEMSYASLMKLPGLGPGVEEEAVAEQVEVQVKYAGYIERQLREIERTRRSEEWPIPESLDYENVVGLSAEVREKLCRQRPVTLGQAGRIPGVTPAALSVLLVHIKRVRGAC